MAGGTGAAAPTSTVTLPGPGVPVLALHITAACQRVAFHPVGTARLLSTTWTTSLAPPSAVLVTWAEIALRQDGTRPTCPPPARERSPTEIETQVKRSPTFRGGSL